MATYSWVGNDALVAAVISGSGRPVPMRDLTEEEWGEYGLEGTAAASNWVMEGGSSQQPPLTPPAPDHPDNGQDDEE